MRKLNLLILVLTITIMLGFGINTTVHALSWQTAPIIGYDAVLDNANGDPTGHVTMITGETPTKPDGTFYYDEGNNLVLGPTIPHYSMAGDPLEGIGDPSLTDLYFDPSTYNATGDYWYDPDTTIYAGSGVSLTANTVYTYEGRFSLLGTSLSIRTAYDEGFSTPANFIMLHSGIGQLWDNYGGDWQYTETWTENNNLNNFITYTRDFTVSAVPEPASMLLLGSGLIGMGCTLKRRKKEGIGSLHTK